MRTIAKGRHRGCQVTHALTDGLEALGEATGSALTLVLLAAHRPSAELMLRGVPKCVRLGGEQSIALQTTLAYYTSDGLLTEAREAVEQCSQEIGSLEAVLGAATVVCEQHSPVARTPASAALASLPTSSTAAVLRAGLGVLPAAAQTVARQASDPQLTVRHSPSDMPAVFNSSSACTARLCFNRLVADGRVDKQEVLHLAVDADRDFGAIAKTPEVIRRLANRHVGLEWVPSSVDLAAVTLFDAVGTESTLFAATCVELWSERRLTVLAQVITCPLPPPWP